MRAGAGRRSVPVRHDVAMGTRPRVVLVCREPIFRLGLRSIVEAAGMTVAGEAADASEAIRLTLDLVPDVLVGATHLRGTAETFLDELCRSAPHVRSVVLAGPGDGDPVPRAAPVVHLRRDSSPEEVREAVWAVHRHEGSAVPVQASADTAETHTRLLTARERQVLQLVALGRRNRDIGQELGIAENTVKNHVRSILDKLVLDSRVEAATFALRHGLDERPDRR